VGENWRNSKRTAAVLYSFTKLDGHGTEVQFLAGAWDFTLLYSIKTNSGSHPTFSLMDTEGSLQVWLSHKIDHSPSFSAKVKNSCSSTPPYTFIGMIIN
jgi:hypothetical protein